MIANSLDAELSLSNATNLRGWLLDMVIYLSFSIVCPEIYIYIFLWLLPYSLFSSTFFYVDVAILRYFICIHKDKKVIVWECELLSHKSILREKRTIVKRTRKHRLFRIKLLFILFWTNRMEKMQQVYGLSFFFRSISR